MAIDIRNINEVTFSQSFRGYNTEEVDDFLDDIYDEAVNNNKEIAELKKRIEELESGAPVDNSAGSEASKEEAYAIIANAQQEADRILEAVRQKAHALILQAENAQKEQVNSSANASSQSLVDAKTVDKLKATLREMYQKQLAVLDDISDNKPIAKSHEPVSAAIPTHVQEPKPVAPPVQEANDIPSVSFGGLARTVKRNIPAERDILGEINTINFGEREPVVQSEPKPEQIDMSDTITYEKAPDPEPEPVSEGISFAFEDDDEVQEEAEVPSSISFETNQATEDPDDIIAQILRDNNRN